MRSEILELRELTLPELAVIVSGTVNMGLQILAGRILAPEYGSSVYTWGSVIGVFMAALSLGYYVGGKRAKRTSEQSISRIMLQTTFYVVFLILASDFIIQALQVVPLGSRYASIPAVVILFGPPSYILGLITPYATELSKKKGKGEASGRIFALGTIGSIAGAFITTFVLIPSLGIATILLLFGVSLVILPLFYSNGSIKAIAFLAALVLLGGYAVEYTGVEVGGDTVYHTQTPYQELEVVDSNGIRTMYLDGQPNSAMYLNGSDQHVLGYTRYFHMPFLMTENVDRALFIGGGGFTGPKRFVNDYNTTVDVVEIDPEVVDSAKEHFHVNESEKMNIHVMDGREYLESTNRTYDVIILDAYKRDEVPFHLTTEEFIGLTYNSLDEDGVLLANVISAPSGPGSDFFRSQYKTVKQVFPNIYAFPTYDSSLIQNMEIIATKQGNYSEEELLKRNERREIGIELEDEIRGYMTDIKTSDVPILKDDKAPVHSLLEPSAKNYVMGPQNKSD